MSGAGQPPLKPGQQQSYRQSSGKLEIIQCRVCRKEMKHQNYQTHLKFQHPAEDHKNLRIKSNKSIMNMFDGQKQSVKRPGTKQQGEGSKKFQLDENQNSANVTNLEVIAKHDLVTEAQAKHTDVDVEGSANSR